MQINPAEYKADIDSACLYHSFSSILNTAALITLSWLSFSPSSPLTPQNHNQEKCNHIAYPIYAGLLILPSLALYFVLSPFVKMFMQNDTPVDQHTPENFNRIKTILRNHADTFHITAEPEIHIINNDTLNAFAYHLFSCTSQHLFINSGVIKNVSRNVISVKILLAHELMHFKNDFPTFSVNSFQYLLYLFNILFLIFGYTPMQIGFSIGGAATIGFQPAFVYLPLIGLLLSTINIVSFFHRHRTQEKNADYCSLFSEQKFENEEYDKHRRYYAAYSKGDSLCHTLFGTHPTGSERIALLNAAQREISPPIIELGGHSH